MNDVNIIFGTESETDSVEPEENFTDEQTGEYHTVPFTVYFI